MTLVPIKLRSPARCSSFFNDDLAQNLWSDAFCNFFEQAPAASNSWAPAVDIKEEESNYLVKADVPGVQPSDIEITMEDGTLTIKGSRESMKEEDEKGYHRVERTYGSFVRRFSFPNTVDVDGIQANSKDGVLEIVIPKKEAAKPKKIEVK